MKPNPRPSSKGRKVASRSKETAFAVRWQRDPEAELDRLGLKPVAGVRLRDGKAEWYHVLATDSGNVPHLVQPSGAVRLTSREALEEFGRLACLGALKPGSFDTLSLTGWLTSLADKLPFEMPPQGKARVIAE